MVTPAMKVCYSFLNHLCSYRMVEYVHRFIKRTVKFFRQYCNDSGVLGLNYYVF